MRIFLPVRDLRRARKPCLRLRLRCEGWYSEPYVVNRTPPRGIWEGLAPAFLFHSIGRVMERIGEDGMGARHAVVMGVRE